MPFPLGDGKTVQVRADTAFEHRVSIDDQVMRRDRRAEVWSGGLDERDRLLGRYVLQHHS